MSSLPTWAIDLGPGTAPPSCLSVLCLTAGFSGESHASAPVCECYGMLGITSAFPARFGKAAVWLLVLRNEAWILQPILPGMAFGRSHVLIPLDSMFCTELLWLTPPCTASLCLQRTSHGCGKQQKTREPDKHCRAADQGAEAWFFSSPLSLLPSPVPSSPRLHSASGDKLTWRCTGIHGARSSHGCAEQPGTSSRTLSASHSPPTSPLPNKHCPAVR